MLNKLAKNQYVKIIKDDLGNSGVEYGVVLNDENENYDIMTRKEKANRGDGLCEKGSARG